MRKKISQKKLVFDYYKDRPNKELQHAEVVDFVTNKYLELTGRVFRDPDRAIRSLHQEGKLIKISRGIYKYDPNFTGIDKTKQVFTEGQKKIILKNGDYKCAICGATEANGVELHCDHIIPIDKGGTSSVKNGQVLCSRHNFIKKTFQQTETGKKMFINLYKSLNEDNRESEALKKFIIDVLKVYEKHNINDHIKFKKDKIYSKDK